jgi:hypothetical protein
MSGAFRWVLQSSNMCHYSSLLTPQALQQLRLVCITEPSSPPPPTDNNDSCDSMSMAETEPTAAAASGTPLSTRSSADSLSSHSSRDDTPPHQPQQHQLQSNVYPSSNFVDVDAEQQQQQQQQESFWPSPSIAYKNFLGLNEEELQSMNDNLNQVMYFPHQPPPLPLEETMPPQQFVPVPFMESSYNNYSCGAQRLPTVFEEDEDENNDDENGNHNSSSSFSSSSNNHSDDSYHCHQQHSSAQYFRQQEFFQDTVQEETEYTRMWYNYGNKNQNPHLLAPQHQEQHQQIQRLSFPNRSMVDVDNLQYLFYPEEEEETRWASSSAAAAAVMGQQKERPHDSEDDDDDDEPMSPPSACKLVRPQPVRIVCPTTFVPLFRPENDEAEPDSEVTPLTKDDSICVKSLGSLSSSASSSPENNNTATVGTVRSSQSV